MTSTETKMQTAVITHSDGFREPKPTPLPMPSNILLETAFEHTSMLVINNEETGHKYSWDVYGNVRMLDMNNGSMYKWEPAPTMQEAIYTRPGGCNFIFKKDGTIILRDWLSPSHVWEYVWPTNPETVLVDGDVMDTWYEWDDHEDYVTDCGDDESEKDDTWHTHRGHMNHGFEEYWCNEPGCVRCPGCGGPYDGDDHGGLGCSRECAYHTDEFDRYDRW
jgi:hypothetical protein